MASGSTKFVRWPWLILAALGFIGCVVFLVIPLTRSRAPQSAPMQQELGGPGKIQASIEQGKKAPPMTGGVPEMRPPAPTLVAPVAPAPIEPPAPTNSDALKPVGSLPHDAGAKKPAKKLAKPAAPQPAPTQPQAEKPTPRVATLAPDTSDASSSPPPTAKPPVASSPEGYGGEIGKIGLKADKPHVAKKHKRPHKDARAHDDGVTSGRGKAKGPPGPPGPPGEEDGDAHGKAESRAYADLLPGSFSAKVPQKMLINESVRVRATVVEKKDEGKAAAVLEIAPVGPGPSKIVTEEVLVGKLLRVELRGLAREFEILPITPPEQRLYPGRVAQWEWVVVPREEGQHELSIVVTNLFDWNGRPLDLTVHSALVSVDVTTMQRLRGYASVVSSIFSGITGLLGAWMALLRPFLKRRAEKEEDDKEKKKDKDGGDDKPPEKADANAAEKPAEKPADSAAVPPPAVAAAADAAQKPAP